MHAQLEQPNEVHEVKEPKDMTAQELAQRTRDFSAAAMATLNRRREEDYAAACAPFDEELAALAAEADDIEAEGQAVVSRLASAERIKRFEYDQLNMHRKDAEAQAKLAELEEIQAGPAKIEERRREIADRVTTIEAQKRTALRGAGEAFLEGCIMLIRANETVLALCLDESRANLNNLETRLGVSVYQPEMLTAHERSGEWYTLNRLYAGVGR